MSSRSGSSMKGTSRPASAISAVSTVREKRVWRHSSSGTCAICCPSSVASAWPFSVSFTGIAGSPLTRCSRLSVDSPWREITNSRTSCQRTTPRLESLWSKGRVTTQVEELPPYKVRLTVEVPRAEVHQAVEHAASDLAASVKVPGFRKGKVPMPVLVNRIGKERLYAEAIESHIAGWYGNAVARFRIRPADRPELDYELPSTDQEDWRFTATVPVTPKTEVADWTRLEVGAPEVEVPEELVDAELDVLRGSVAELSPVEGRPAQLGDTVVLDLIRDGGDGQKDYVTELGSGRLVP